jgi:alpha-amylase
MKSISLSFQVHQFFRLKKYRFFDVGNDPYYYDDFENERKVRFAAESFYLPANEILKNLLTKYQGQFKIAFSISGIAIDQFSLYAPEVIKSFQQLADTGKVEFLCEPYSHSLASLFNKEEFIRQSQSHALKLKELFNQTPTSFNNSELIYSDEIGEIVAQMGYKTILTEGSKHVLKWRSPNYLYSNPKNPDLSILLKNQTLSEDFAFRLPNTDWTGHFSSALKKIPHEEKILNIFLNYEVGGQELRKGKKIFNFLKSISAILGMNEYRFLTPSEISSYYNSVGEVSFPEPISRADKEDGLYTWTGNDLQKEALKKLYSVTNIIEDCDDTGLLKDWQFLQSLDHLYYMSSKFFNQGKTSLLNPYNNPYEAFLNYMNILDDFVNRINQATSKKTSRFSYSKSKETMKV